MVEWLSLSVHSIQWIYTGQNTKKGQESFLRKGYMIILLDHKNENACLFLLGGIDCVLLTFVSCMLAKELF